MALGTVTPLRKGHRRTSDGGLLPVTDHKVRKEPAERSVSAPASFSMGGASCGRAPLSTSPSYRSKRPSSRKSLIYQRLHD